MANASAKRVASQNVASVKNLRLGLAITCLLSLLLRLLLRRDSLSPKRMSFWIFALSLIPSTFLSHYIMRIGSPRHDPTTGTLLSAGEDLSRPGIIEWCFDVIYITWACQVGSGGFGDWVWWLYLIIPAYALYKLWNSVLSPLLLGRNAPSENVDEGGESQPLSKRQEKLRKRGDRGDPRVRVQTSR